MMRMAAEVANIWQTLVALAQEVAELHRPGERARLCQMMALAVAIAVTAALALHLDNPWWAGISAYMSVQATRPASLVRGVLRITGTVCGAAVALLLVPWLAYDHLACCLALLLLSALGTLGFTASQHGYAWLLAGITSVMVLLMSLDAPTMALNVAFYRILEVTLGTVSAIVVALLLAPDASQATKAADPPGWTDLLGAQWPAVLHALRCGLAVSLMPLVWSQLELPSLSQMAITVAAVMAVQVQSDHQKDDGRIIIERAVHRMIGCCFGGLAGVAVLAVSITQFVPWLVLLTAGVWVGAHVQASQRGVGYIGVQGSMVFIMTLVQSYGPPTSILPGIDRFAGIACGLAVLLVISLLIWPTRRTAHPAIA